MANAAAGAVQELSTLITSTSEGLDSNLAALKSDVQAKSSGQPMLAMVFGQILGMAQQAVNSAKASLSSVQGMLPGISGAWQIEAVAEQARSAASDAESYASQVQPQNLASRQSWSSAASQDFTTRANQHADAAQKAAERARRLADRLGALSATATSSAAQVVTNLSTAVTTIAERSASLVQVESAIGAIGPLGSASANLTTAKNDGETTLKNAATAGSDDLGGV